jgi:hypothetical protein
MDGLVVDVERVIAGEMKRRKLGKKRRGIQGREELNGKRPCKSRRRHQAAKARSKL